MSLATQAGWLIVMALPVACIAWTITGISLLRPMYYDWPEAPEAYEFKHEYRFGPRVPQRLKPL